MAITTLDGVLAGAQQPRRAFKATVANAVAGRPLSFWAGGGAPGAGSFDSTLNGVTLSSTSSAVNGQIPFTDPVSGNTYLSRFSAVVGGVGGQLILVDRLWHNGGFNITSTSAQSITSPTFPARDINGATNGDGVFLAMEISSATGAGTPLISVSYTNQSGTSGRTATNIDATAASSVAGSFYRIGLQAGDTGVRSVQSVTLSATWTSGTMNLVAYRPIASLDIPAASTGASIDALTSGMPRLYNGSVPFLIQVPSAAAAGYVEALIAYTQG